MRPARVGVCFIVQVRRVAGPKLYFSRAEGTIALARFPSKPAKPRRSCFQLGHTRGTFLRMKARQGQERAPPRAVLRVAILGAVGAAFSGCTFGDVDGPAKTGIDQFVYDNCVPEECLYECCQGWNYSPAPTLVGATWDTCGTFITNWQYAQYNQLMGEKYNSCSPEFASIEGGLCTIVRPADVFKKSSPNGKLVYAGLSFVTCAPRGQTATCPVEGVEIVPQD